MRKKLMAFLLAALVLSCVLPPGLAAEGETGTAVFESGVPDADGVFEVSLTVSNMTFRTFEFVLRYDTQVLQPVDREGKPAQAFGQFAGLTPEAAWLSTVGTVLDAQTGFIDFTAFVMPGLEGEYIQQSDRFGTQVVLGDQSLRVFTFRFKRLKEGDAGLQIATEEKGEPYQHVLPHGANVSGNEGRQSVTVIFRDAAKPDQSAGESYTPSSGGSGRPSKTADSLLKEAVILRLGSPAAVVKGGAVALYPGEKMVTAYAHDNRTFVPVRFVAERLGAQVDWDNDARAAIVKKDGHEIRMPIGSSTFTLDGAEKPLDAPAELTASTDGNSRTMVPIRFVSEALDYQVEWDQARNLVVIAPKSLRWDPKGSVEAQAMDKALGIIAVYGGFV